MKRPILLSLICIGALFPKLSVPLLGLALIASFVGLSLILWFNLLTAPPATRRR